jgi:hypothetical protein
MNIYVNDNLMSKEELMGYLEELKPVFPLFFDKKNPKPVVIHYRDDMKYMVRKRRGAKEFGQMSVAHPLPQIVKCMKFARNDYGMSDMFVLTRGVREVNRKTGEPFYPTKDIMFQLSNGKTLHPGQDEVELVYWYFFSGKFTNGKVDNPRAEFHFTNPVVESKDRIEKNREVFELQKDILYGGVSTVDIERYMSTFGLEISALEEVNRTTLFDYVTTSPGAKESYYNILRSDSDNQNLAEAMGLVREAIERGKITSEGDNWVFVNKTGNGRPFAPIDVKDDVKGLSKIILEDERLRQRLEKSLQSAE